MRKPIFALAAMLGLLVSAGAHAEVALTFGSNRNLRIVGDGTQAVINFGSGISPEFTDIEISFGDDVVGNGRFTGNFSFLRAEITDPDGNLNPAPTTTELTAPLYSNDPVQLVVQDNFGGQFIANVESSRITSYGNGVVSVINPNLVINLVDMIYMGDNLTSVFAELASKDLALITFNFDANVFSPRNLFALVGPTGTTTTTFTGYSGSIGGFDGPVNIPEPGPIVLTALSVLPLMGIYLRRRRHAA